MKTVIKNLIYLAVLLIFSCVSCSKDESNIGDEEEVIAQTFEEIIASGNDIPTFPQSRTTDVIAESEPFNEDYSKTENGETTTERFLCTSKTLSVLDGNGQFPLFDTASDVVYPGSLLQGKTISNATPSPILVPRAGGTVSYNLNNGNLNSSFTVDEVKKSTIQNGMNTIIANAGEVVPANFQLEIEQIESESQLALELGIDVQTYTTQVSADMSFSSEQEFNRTLVKLTQSYYTMSFDLPTSLDQIFGSNVTPQQLSTYVQPDNPATFISSVTYGRIFYMLIESTSSRQEMSAKLNLAYGAFNNSAEGNLSVNAMQELNNLKIKVIAYGGDSKGTFQLAGETNIQAIANKLAESTDIRAGLPLSYVIRSVERPDKIVGTELATEYDIIECELRGILPPQGLLALVDLFADDEDGGGIGAMLNIAESNTIVFNKMGTRYAWYNANSGEIKAVFNISDANSPLGNLPIDNVGAALKFGTKLHLYDKTGLVFSRISYIASNYTSNDSAPTEPIGTFDAQPDGNMLYLVNTSFGSVENFPFTGQGFEAAAKVGSSTYAIFGKPGNSYALYKTSNGGSWNSAIPSSNWFDIEHTGTDLFENVGAAAEIRFGGSNVRFYLVNEAGNEIMEYTSLPTRIMKGPWIIN